MSKLTWRHHQHKQASLLEEPAKYSSWTVMTKIESFASPIVSDSMLSSRYALRMTTPAPHSSAAAYEHTTRHGAWTMSWSESADRSARATDLR